MVKVELNVNGKDYSVEIKPDEMLSDLLRVRLGLTGTKISCGEAECGVCTVLVDDEPILSCNYPALKANGKQVVTIHCLTIYHGASTSQEIA